MAQRQVLDIEGMTCASYARHVDAALRGAGVQEVEVDHRQGEAVFDPGEVGEATIRAAVSGAGYDPGAYRVLARPPVTDAGEPVARRRAWLGNDVGIGVGAAALIAVCCAGPLLLAALATGGAGAWLAATGAWLGGLALLAVGGLGVVLALRRRAGGRS